MPNSKLNITESQLSIIAKNENILTAWKDNFIEIKDLLEMASPNNDYVKVKGAWQNFCPWTQYITLDALHEKDYPNGIAQNSIYITFKINLANKKVEISGNGHVYISNEDKEIYGKDKYLAMHSMIEVTKRNKGKVMRKTTYKDNKDLAKRIIKAFDDIMGEVKDYTGGYPYKKGIKALKTA